MASKAKVYVIDDDEAMRDSLNFLLDSAGLEVTLFETAQQFLDALARDWDSSLDALSRHLSS